MPPTNSMTPEAIVTIGAAVVALTTLIKLSAFPTDKRWVVIAIVFVLSGLGCAIWGFSKEVVLTRELLWPYFAAWISVATASAGVFGLAQKEPEVTHQAETHTSP
jgi:hypothetical protein